MTGTFLFDAGFEALVSVVPPGAELSRESKIPPKDRGKAPGRKNYQGVYAGYGWRTFWPTRDIVAQWDSDGNNIGLRADTFPAFDVDILDANIAANVRAVIEGQLDVTVTRYGRRPKVLLLYRAAERMTAIRHKYEHSLTGETHLVEFLAEGQQYVVCGTHPGTGLPYEIEDPVGAFGVLGANVLREIGREDVDRVFEAIDALMAELGFKRVHATSSSAAGSEVDQDSLLAPDADTLLDLVGKIPNDLETREEWIQFGHAIKAASQADPGAGYEAWAEWSSRWEGGNDPADVERDWAKMKEPYRVGWGYLLDMAKRHGVSSAGYEFGEAESAPDRPAEPQSHSTPIRPTDPEVAASMAALAGREGQPGEWTDSALSKEFVATVGQDYFYVEELHQTFHWDGKTWQPERHLSHRVQQFLDDKANDARMLSVAASKKEEIVNKLGGRRTRGNITANVLETPGMCRLVEELDGDRNLLNTPAGPYDLRTGKRVSPHPGRLLVRRTTVAPDFEAQCPIWERFISESMLGDEDMVDYLQISFGYFLTGRTESQIFPFYRGGGSNGKTKCIEVLVGILGRDDVVGYAAIAHKDLLQTTKTGNSRDNRQDLAQLVGKRLIITSETDAGSRWDEQIIKQITGGDYVQARQLYKSSFSYLPTYKLLVIGNYEPDLASVGQAMRRRLHLVPWLNRPVNRDDDLGKKLRAEYPAILAWMIKGAQKWYESGMPNPKIMRAETEDYLGDQDILGQWIEDCITVTDNEDDFVSTEELYSSYAGWMQSRRHYVGATGKFAKLIRPRLEDLGGKRSNSRPRGYRGIEVHVSSEFMADNVTPLPVKYKERQGSQS